jgi:hypothetical protein
MSLYSISGLGCSNGCSCSGTDEPFGQLSVISGRKKRQARRAKRKERKTRLYCKGALVKRAALAVPRKAFLTLVRLNFKKFALKLYKSLQDPAKKKALSAKWCKLGGDFKILERNILKAVEKYKRKHKGRVNGIGEPVALALISTATPIVIALLQFLKGQPVESPEATATEETESEETAPAQEQTESEGGETVEGIGGIDPYLLAGIVGVGVYYLTKKGKI